MKGRRLKRMKVIIGNAWCDENGRPSGGKPGDQKQKKVDDYSGEVRLQDFYSNKKGWNILRFKNKDCALKAAALMKIACNNINIGYSQTDRDGIIKAGIETEKPCNCDCSSLVRKITMEVSGKKIPDFYTATEVSVLQKTGLFQPTISYKAGVTLYTGDIIVTKVKGHTAIIVEGMPFTNPFAKPASNVTSKANAKKQGCKNFIYEGEGVQWVQYELCRNGYQEDIDAHGGIDGVCGKATVDCITCFQIVKGLEDDGICGPITRKALEG